MTTLSRYFRTTLLPLANTGNVAWLLHRLTGLVLAAYLVPHFISINAARGGPEALDAELAFYDAPLFAALEWLLVGVVAFHACNGLRVIALDAFALSGHQRLLFWLVLLACGTVFAAASLLFVPRILGPV